ncbi:MAG: hypothetical protein COT73_03990 [Bdellovibrio sp. CG10_big_fil_rev_8_21_14_0_10_47_8]|nr:MAG: hypothetical protein COT73_03990 [Bdellovibrio sp. CG10_big_fil_rev_8_21_14_0_10_47_8]
MKHSLSSTALVQKIFNLFQHPLLQTEILSVRTEVTLRYGYLSKMERPVTWSAYCSEYWTLSCSFAFLNKMTQDRQVFFFINFLINKG